MMIVPEVSEMTRQGLRQGRYTSIHPGVMELKKQRRIGRKDMRALVIRRRRRVNGKGKEKRRRGRRRRNRKLVNTIFRSRPEVTPGGHSHRILRYFESPYWLKRSINMKRGNIVFCADQFGSQMIKSI